MRTRICNPAGGARLHRRRVFNAAVALVMAVLLGVGPESVLALHQEALFYRAMAAGAVAQTGPVETLYAYDANGNLTGRTRGGLTDSYVYDAENRLVTADLHIDRTSFASYTYDPDGIRQSATVDGQTTWHLTDKNRPYAQVLQERDGAGRTLAVRYTYGDDLISQTRPGDPDAVTRYYHYDGQLSTRQLTDAAADPAAVAVTDTYTFDAFGNLLASTGSTLNPYLYTGEQYDPNVGFYYLRARFYDPEKGRFVSRDPAAGSMFDPRTLHRYVYTANDPVNRVDPSGREFTLPAVVQNIQIRSMAYMATISATVAAAFRAGGGAIGRLWNAIGNFAMNTFRQVLATRPDLVVSERIRYLNRVIDFTVRSGDKVAQVEVKYGLPDRIGDALSRLVAQMTAAAQSTSDQLVLWTLKEPTTQQVNLVLRQLGAPVADRTQFVHGVDGLWRWLTFFFGPG